LRGHDREAGSARFRRPDAHRFAAVLDMPPTDSRVAVYTGSFDPITLGHLNVIERAGRLVDRLIVGIGINVGKDPMFTLEERVDLVRKTTARFPNVEVQEFSGLAVHFVRRCGARVMIRGVRPLTDLDTEMTMMMANRQLDPGLETVVLLADAEFAHVSSSLIKQIAPIAGDEELARFIPPEVIAALRKKMDGRDHLARDI
jgi:pantetheine-phosphate adenylyltransferase